MHIQTPRHTPPSNTHCSNHQPLTTAAFVLIYLLIFKQWLTGTGLWPDLTGQFLNTSSAEAVSFPRTDKTKHRTVS